MKLPVSGKVVLLSLNANNLICSFAGKIKKKKNSKEKLFYGTPHGSFRKRPLGRLSMEVHGKFN